MNNETNIVDLKRLVLDIKEAHRVGVAWAVETGTPEQIEGLEYGRMDTFGDLSDDLLELVTMELEEIQPDFTVTDWSDDASGLVESFIKGALDEEYRRSEELQQYLPKQIRVKTEYLNLREILYKGVVHALAEKERFEHHLAVALEAGKRWVTVLERPEQAQPFFDRRDNNYGNHDPLDYAHELNSWCNLLHSTILDCDVAEDTREILLKWVEKWRKRDYDDGDEAMVLTNFIGGIFGE